MKYIKYLSLVAFTLFRKTWGLFWFFIVVYFRDYARSVVQNYALSTHNNIRLKRLDERTPCWSSPSELHGWILKDVHNVGYNGFVEYRQVGALEFWLVVFLLWGWVDDDANEDTYDAGHIKNNWSWINIKECTYGSTFDLGDQRAECPCFNLLAALVWNTRNTGYNFDYLFQQTNNEAQVFLWTIFGYRFGWVPDSSVGSTKYWMMVIGSKV